MEHPEDLKESELKEIKATSKDTTRPAESLNNSNFLLEIQLKTPENQIGIRPIPLPGIAAAIDSGH